MKRNILKMLFVASTFFLLTSCSTFKFINTNALKIGMSKNEAQKAIRIKPYGIVASKRIPENNKVLEVVGYNDGAQSYWLYFEDGILERWEPANKFGPSI